MGTFLYGVLLVVAVFTGFIIALKITIELGKRGFCSGFFFGGILAVALTLIFYKLFPDLVVGIIVKVWPWYAIAYLRGAWIIITAIIGEIFGLN
jgi:hypothetical protein